MSFNEKNNSQLNEIINQNNEMRNIIYDSVNNIEFLFKEFYKEQKYIKSKENENINLSEIDNLPISDQIELYKDCIIELQKETPEIKNDRLEIENINREINDLKLKINEEKKINNSLEKMNTNYLKIIKNIDTENANLKLEEKEFLLKTLIEEYHNLKEEYREIINLIKKQDKSLLILEDNCKFIGENIYYYKNNENDLNKENNNDFEEIKKIAEDVQSLKENLENKYEHKIKKQKDEINRLKEFNSVLTEIIEEQKKNNKLELINERINYLEDDK